MIIQLINPLTSAQMTAWIQRIAALEAVQIDYNPQRSMAIWKYSFLVEGQPHDIFYAGPSANEGHSFLVCRDFAIAGVAYKQGIRQFTEPTHQGAGFGRWTLQVATRHYGVIVGDDAGMTPEAYRLWSNPKGGIGVEAIDVATGTRKPNDPQLYSAWPSAQVDVLILTNGNTAALASSTP
ncbi:MULTISPECIES: hypothetical protein [unclassified Dyella]|uniref:hypothetical protein n=1 Tax=Dyella sp. ASV21 TaxID=2795114 RepID=UPI0018EB0023|nr:MULTISPECIES: hypothetical protein [unclassified Dyella]